MCYILSGICSFHVTSILNRYCKARERFPGPPRSVIHSLAVHEVCERVIVKWHEMTRTNFRTAVVGFIQIRRHYAK